MFHQNSEAYSHIGDLVHHLLLFLVLQHHHELALVEARDEKAKKRAPEKEKKNWRVAIVRLENVRFSGVASVRIWGWQTSDIWGWQLSAWQMTYPL